MRIIRMTMAWLRGDITWYSYCWSFRPGVRSVRLRGGGMMFCYHEDERIFLQLD